MEIVKLEATARTEHGKSPAKRLRASGQIPAIAYGRQLAPVSLAVSPKGLRAVLEGPFGKNTVVELGIEGKRITVMVRDYSFHPISRDLLHADFVEVKLDQPVDVEVPFICKGKAAGVVLGGIMRQVYRALPLRCLPEKIPLLIEHDISSLGLGDHVKASELALPEGVSVRLPADQTVAGVVAPEKERAEDVAATGTPGAAPAAAAAGAAPAAAAKKDEKAAPAGKDKKK